MLQPAIFLFGPPQSDALSFLVVFPRHFLLLCLRPQTARFARYDPKGCGAHILRAATYPGEQTGAIIKAGKVIVYSETATVRNAHCDGNSYAVTFYRLGDDRGWVHDFSCSKPRHLAFTVIVSDEDPRPFIYQFLSSTCDYFE